MHGAGLVICCVAIGVATGVLSAMFGVGGAVISTPGIRALGATAIQGVGSTMPSVLPSAIAGTLRYHREGLVRWSVVATVAPVGAVFAVAGAVASVRFPGQGHVQMILTASLVLTTAVSTARRQQPGGTTAQGAPTAEQRGWRAALIGAGAGALSGFLGVGGGILMTPTFRGWLGLPIKQTVATSLACVGLIAIPSSITHIVEGTVAWQYALPLAIGVVPGARLGAHLAIRASDRHLRLVLAGVLGAVGVAYGIAEIVALVA